MQNFTICDFLCIQLDCKLQFYYYRDFHIQFQSYEIGSNSRVVLDAGEN